MAGKKVKEGASLSEISRQSRSHIKQIIILFILKLKLVSSCLQDIHTEPSKERLGTAACFPLAC